MAQTRTLRRDARDNMAKLRAAAVGVFLAKGLDVPLEEIAKAAGVSIGTLYNRFGSREALIDDVIPDIVTTKLTALHQAVLAEDTPRQRLEAFITGMVDLQQHDPALNDAILRRHPGATALVEVCDHTRALGHQLLEDAHADGSLAADFDNDDLVALLWLAGTASRDPDAPTGWRRALMHSLGSAWTT